MKWTDRLLEAIRRGSVEATDKTGATVAKAEIGAVRGKKGSVRTGMKGGSAARQEFASKVRTALKPTLKNQEVKVKTDTAAGPRHHAMMPGKNRTTTVTKIDPGDSPNKPRVAGSPTTYKGRKTTKVTRTETNPEALSDRETAGKSNLVDTRKETRRPGRIVMDVKK